MDYTINALKSLQETQQANKKYLGEDNYHNKDFVVCQANGEPYSPKYISRNYRRVLKEYKHKVKINNEVKEYSLYELLDIPLIRFHDLSYPNPNKIQTFHRNTGFYRNSYCKRFGFYLYFLLGFNPQNSTSEPLAFFHFGVTFLSFSSSKVAKAFASSSVVMSKYTIVVWSCS